MSQINQLPFLVYSIQRCLLTSPLAKSNWGNNWGCYTQRHN